QVMRLRVDAHALHSAHCVVHPLEMVANRLHCNGIVARFCLREISVPQSENDRRGADLFIRGPRSAGFASLSLNLPALVEVILHPRAAGEIGYEIELIPQTVELFLPLLIE